ncbi:NIPSNAP protein [Actinokineospora alba]|uniref:NIPSNAP protein n=1 Tax=Actinokineospora alba TaxID=504798 RepID=A0A1H0GDD8_9PSEU|nr:NIPSNAP family protein [Actinokineospora alba]TDP69852.1 NIPSNAP protein [Actinokineospora alba]SDI07277.1 NIPSNAP protein [Actinokineospora alba]SDO04927.1 NIPSNAP protein [Actinokineospora alba]
MIFELRQYTLHPGRRDELISLFEREFVEPQLALGMTLPGLFRDAGDPDRFVWMRGFEDMPARKAALAAFYGGPVWKAHRDAANATMIDSDNVLLLSAVRDFADVSVGSPLTAMIHYFDAPVAEDLVEKAAAEPFLAVFRGDYSENTFPALPVRLGEHVLVTFGEGPALSARVETLTLEPTDRSALR